MKHPLDVLHDFVTWRDQLTLVMVTMLLLSAAGVYALISFTVAQRRREIGMRAALGAPPHRVLQSNFTCACALRLTLRRRPGRFPTERIPARTSCDTRR